MSCDLHQSVSLPHTNMVSAITLVLGLVVAVSAQYGHGGYGHEEHHVDYYTHPHYKFDYSVHDPHTYDIKKHDEERKDDHVKGYYSLHEADGTVRHVHYTADHKNGFNAVVHREGKAQHPAIHESSKETFYKHYHGKY